MRAGLGDVSLSDVRVGVARSAADRNGWSPSALLRFPARKTIFKAVLWVIGLVAFGAGLLQTNLFTLDRIDVTGSSQLPRNEILSLAKLKTGESIASVNAASAESRLEAHPWILHADVTVDWPHVVKVAITEQRAVAIAPTADKKWVQLGPDGTVLAVSDKPVAKLPALVGVQAPNEVGRFLDASAAPIMSVATLMPASLAPRVTQMQEQNGLLRLGLDSGTIVNLGDYSELSEKLLSAASVISHTDPKTLAELDVTSPRFPVARPVGQSSAVKSGVTSTSTTVPGAKKSQKTSTTTTTLKTSR